jgi:CHC2 zinc finger
MPTRCDLLNDVALMDHDSVIAARLHRDRVARLQHPVAESDVLHGDIPRLHVELDVVDAVLSLASRTEVFVGVLPRARPGGRIADVVKRSSVLWADCDTSASVAALASFEPSPSMVVASGSDRHLHAYWFLQEPVDLDRLEHLNRRLAAALGADGGVVTKPHTILRPAGSVNRKHSPPAPARLIGLQEGHRPGADEIDAQLPRERTEPASMSHAGLSRASSLVASSDPLRLVPPPVYFERLTALRVGRSGKLRCLFHDDRSPSLHVYREPGRGWYCFGCGRGGSRSMTSRRFFRGARLGARTSPSCGASSRS